MSWSISLRGTPGEIAEGLDKYGAALTGQHKAEFDTAAQHLEALVNINASADGRCKLDFTAWGSVSLDFSTDPPTEVSSSCFCRITAVPVGPAL